jgi:hypothetical protein
MVIQEFAKLGGYINQAIFVYQNASNMDPIWKVMAIWK